MSIPSRRWPKPSRAPAPADLVLPSKPYFGPTKKAKLSSKTKSPGKVSSPSPSPPLSETGSLAKTSVASKPGKHGYAPGSKVVPSQKFCMDVMKSAFNISMPKKEDDKVSYPSKTDRQFRSGFVFLMALFDANAITEYPNGHGQYEYEHNPLSTDKSKRSTSMKVHKFCAKHNVEFVPKTGKWIEHQVGEAINHGVWLPGNAPAIGSSLHVKHAEILIKLILLQK
jgi:hypothetical protein